MQRSLLTIIGTILTSQLSAGSAHVSFQDWRCGVIFGVWLAKSSIGGRQRMSVESGLLSSPLSIGATVDSWTSTSRCGVDLLWKVRMVQFTTRGALHISLVSKRSESDSHEYRQPFCRLVPTNQSGS